MEYKINQLSFYAENVLNHLKTGTVHSVYRRTVNLTDGKNLLSLQARHSPLSPISLITSLSAEEMGSLNIKPGDIVRFVKDGFFLLGAAQSYHFTAADAARFDLKLAKSLDARLCAALSSNIRNALSVAGTGGFAPLFNKNGNAGGSLSPILLAAHNYILQCNELCISKKYREAALKLSHLLGLGIGLTPSGDDFLCGVLAGLSFSGNSNHDFTLSLKSEIAARLSDTIDISAAFLSCALENQYSLPVNDLCRIPDSKAILDAFKEIGHSSGLDTLCGILWSFEHI